VQTLRELFEHSLRSIDSFEQRLLPVLQDMEDECAGKAVRKAFADHREQTHDHVKRLEEVRKKLALEAGPARPCPVLDALLRDKETFLATAPTDELLDCYNLLAGMRLEHEEIAAYEGLIEVAEKLRLLEATHLLQANLEEERSSLARLHRLLRAFKIDFHQSGGVLQPAAPHTPASA
jgi:ferritin-like metal-binding protein YciE